MKDRHTPICIDTARRSTLGLLLAGSGLLAMPGLAPAALAQVVRDDWDWTDGELFHLEGTILEIYMGEPNATLSVDAKGEIWEVELASPARTVASGFTENIARVGDEVTAVGSRAKDRDEMRMKASRITLGDRNYDIYPRRVPAG